MPKNALSRLQPYWPALRYRLHIVVLCIGTFAYGLTLLLDVLGKPLSYIDLFPLWGDLLLLPSLLLLPIGKIVAIFHPNPRTKKYFLMGILLCWLAITWGYWNTETPNVGYVITGMVVLLCYVELYRGEVTSHA